jgi:hypothetical protein
LLTVWQEPQIIALEIRLERYRRQLDTVLLISLKESIESISEGTNKHERVSSHVLGKNPTNEWKAELIDSLYRENWQSMREEDLANFSAKFSAGSKQEKEFFDQLRILEKLRFRNMEDRAEGIAAAHAKFSTGYSLMRRPRLMLAVILPSSERAIKMRSPNPATYPGTIS